MAEVGVVTSPESCKDHHRHALFPAKAEGCLTSSPQQRREHAVLNESKRVFVYLDMEF